MTVIWTDTAQEHLDETLNGIDVLAVLHCAQDCLKDTDG